MKAFPLILIFGVFLTSTSLAEDSSIGPRGGLDVQTVVTGAGSIGYGLLTHKHWDKSPKYVWVNYLDKKKAVSGVKSTLSSIEIEARNYPELEVLSAKKSWTKALGKAEADLRKARLVVAKKYGITAGLAAITGGFAYISKYREGSIKVDSHGFYQKQQKTNSSEIFMSPDVNIIPTQTAE